MPFLRNIANIIYSGYCIVTFFIVITFQMVIFAVLSFVKSDRTRTVRAYRATSVIAKIWLKLCGYKVVVEGEAKIDPDKTYMFVCNHSNMLDLPLTGYFLRHYYKSLAKKELKYIPIMGFLIKTSSVLVDRSNPESRRHSTQIMVDKLREGISFLIFPEGTRNRTGKPLKSFYSGAFKTAIMAQVPVLPFLYLDHHSLQPVRSFRFHPGTLRIKTLDPIDTTGMGSGDAEALQNRVYAAMELTILSEDRDFSGKN